MTRKSLFWIVFVILSALGVLFTFAYFPKAYPIANVKISMSRQQALTRALQLAEQEGWGPAPCQQAATFSLDSELQHFVELEAGGVDAFNELLEGDLYAPYKWIVRHFKENEKTETVLRFTPDGRFYGFTQQLPENQPGASLAVDSALAIARTGAHKWGIDLSPYALIEKSLEKRIGGRTDHLFTFERSDQKLGEGLYRLAVTVSGAQVTGLQHYVKVPEAFERRYQEMRSTNDTLASVALFAVAVLYGLLGIGFGLFYLLKERWLQWRTALLWGLGIGLLQALAQLNQWPLLWMGYDTAISYNSFFMQQILQLLLIFLGETLLLTLTFMAAEGLTRKAFPHQIQLWKNWLSPATASKPVLGHTVGGFLGVSLFFAFDIGLYFFATRVLGWWTPSSSLFDPDILATYQPWLSSVAISLHAGFWEECLFRAIPIAGAVLIGRKYGREKVWLVAAFLVQALIFGAGHANYPMQPAYARVVELLLPSIAFGLVYLYFGLLPGIILHFAYDVVWFALPLFVSSSPGIWVQQLLVILFTLIPLWIVLRARLREKKWSPAAPEELKNQAFLPSAPVHREEVQAEQPAILQSSKRITLWFALAGIAGVLLWGAFTTWEVDSPRLVLNRDMAEKIAQERLAEQGIALPPAWKRLSRLESPLNQNDRFIWQEEGDSMYAALMGTYMQGPFWLVRHALFEGDVVARAEEYQFALVNPQQVRYIHILPENAPGDSLAIEEARAIAEGALLDRFGLDAAQLKKVSVTPTKLKNRIDWQFVWADTARYPLRSGECRIMVELAGKEIANAYQMVYVPEAWSRAEREKNTLINIIDTVRGALPIIALIVAVVFAIIYWSRRQFDVKLFLKVSLLFLMVMLFGLVNNWSNLQSRFVTAAPWQHQILLAVIFSALSVVVASAAVGMVNGFIRVKQRYWAAATSGSTLAALGAGFFILGVLAVIASLAPSLEPKWADYSGLSQRWTVAGLALDGITGLLMSGTILLLLFVVVDQMSHAWTRRKPAAVLLIILAGLALTDVDASGSIAFWLLMGAVKGILFCITYVLVLRRHMSAAVWLAVPLYLVVAVKGMVYAAYPGAQTGYLLSLIFILAVTLIWQRWILCDSLPGARSSGSGVDQVATTASRG